MKLARAQPLDSAGVKVKPALKKLLGMFKYTKIEMIIPREVAYILMSLAFGNVPEKSNIVLCLKVFSPVSQMLLNHADLHCRVASGCLLHKNPASSKVYSK